MEFHECCLMTGATVTLVGELLRSASGELTLQPLSQEQVSWRTSWEKAGAEDLELLEAGAGETPHFRSFMPSSDSF